MMYRYYDYGYPYHSGWEMLFMVIFWVAIIALAVYAVKQFHHHGKYCRGRREDTHSDGNSALEILKTRYAKGEIDKKEFEEKKKDLTEV